MLGFMNFDLHKFRLVVDLSKGKFYVREYLRTVTNYVTK